MERKVDTDEDRSALNYWEVTARALDRWLTDDRNDFGPADAPDPTPSAECPARPPHRPARFGSNGESIDTSYIEVGRRFPRRTFDAAASDAAMRNALETRRAALADRLMGAPEYAWRDIEHAVWAFDRHRTDRNCAACLAELLVDLIDGAL
jgi:hypothetical protein